MNLYGLKSWFGVYGSKRVAILIAVGFSSGLPLALTGSTLQAWLVSEGINLKLIGIFSIVGMPYSLKILWSPLLDRYSIPFLGRRRSWIFIFQVLLAFLFVLLAFLNPSNSIGLVGIVAFMIAFSSASQDIVIDAYRTEVLQPDERGAGAATTVLGYRIAMLVSGALALMLSDIMPWKNVFLLLGIVMLSCVIFTFIAPEPHTYSSSPKSLKEAVVLPFIDYFSRPSAISMLLFIVVFKLGDVLAASMTTPFLLDIGFTRSEVGLVYKAFGLASTLIGALLGGGVMSRIGMNRSLWVFAILQALSNFAFAILAMVGKNYYMLVCAVAIENITGGMGTAGFVAFLMSLCNTRFTATQYALLSSLMALTRVIAGVPTGFLASNLGWTQYFVVTTLGALPGIMLLPKFASWNAKGQTALNVD